jgi:hypothetical protein
MCSSGPAMRSHSVVEASFTYLAVVAVVETESPYAVLTIVENGESYDFDGERN